MTLSELLEAVRTKVLKSTAPQTLALYVFGWATGVCLAAGISQEVLANKVGK